MTDRAKKIAELTALTSAANNDLLIIEDVSANTTKKIVITDLTKVVVANTLVITGNSTPANSTATVTKGTLFYDTNYLYIAVANNTIKRVALDTF